MSHKLSRFLREDGAGSEGESYCTSQRIVWHQLYLTMGSQCLIAAKFSLDFHTDQTTSHSLPFMLSY